MKWLSDMVKDFKLMGSLAGVVITLIGGVWAAEDRYAKADDIAIVQQQLEKKIDGIVVELKIQRYQDIIEQIEDKQELGNATVLDLKRLRRAKQQLELLIQRNRK